MTTQPIPLHWSAEEALRVAALLEDLVRAIWNLHGPAMARYLQDHYDELDAMRDARAQAPQPDGDPWPF